MFKKLVTIRRLGRRALEYVAQGLSWWFFPPPVERARATLAKRFPVFFGTTNGNELFPTFGSASAVLWPLYFLATLVLMWPFLCVWFWVIHGSFLDFLYRNPEPPWSAGTQLKGVLYFLGFDINVPESLALAFRMFDGQVLNPAPSGFGMMLHTMLLVCQMLVSFFVWFATLRALQLFCFDDIRGRISRKQYPIWVVASGMSFSWLMFQSWRLRRLPAEIGNFMDLQNLIFALACGVLLTVLVVQPAQKTWRRKAASRRAKLDLLVPHSWVNSLASLRDLLVTDKVAQAIRFIDHAQPYWAMINEAEKNSEKRTIEEYQSGGARLEVAINNVAVAYLEMMKIQFPSQFTIEARYDDDVRDVVVPHLLLWPLVENAVKYGVRGSDVPHTLISIIANFSSVGDLVIQVNNESPDWDELARNRVEGWGRGHELTLEQLRLFWRNATFRGTEVPHKGYTAVITVPAAELKFSAKQDD